MVNLIMRWTFDRSGSEFKTRVYVELGIIIKSVNGVTLPLGWECRDLRELPQHICNWTKGRLIMYKYQGIWNLKGLHEGSILAQQNFKAQPTDVLLCSYPKTGTTWLKALSFAIAT
ncbi:hypothetical protein R6Q57_017838 [Mikania cordata]